MADSGRDGEAQERGGVVRLDLGSVALPYQGDRLRRAAWHLEDGESLRVHVHGVPWPALAALSGGGFSYRLLSMNDGSTEIAVSRRYTDDQRRRYLMEPLRPRPGYPRNVERYLGESRLLKGES